jgi:hypothetical protein
MSPYNESVSVINTPFGNSAEEMWGFDETYIEPEYSIQNRMLLILAIVSMIVIALSLFALPAKTSAIPASMEENIEQTASQAKMTVPEENSSENLETTLAMTGISPIFTPEVRHWEHKIVEWAAAHDLDPNIVATIMQIESCGNPEAVSIAGARGLFQVMPFHFSGNENMLDPDTNAMRGLNFYNEQLRYTGNDKLLSFAGYNGGYAASGGNFANWPDETKRYYNWAKGIYEDAQSGATSSETLDAWLAAGGAAGCQAASAKLNIK